MPFTTGEIGGSHVSGVELARGLVRGFGVRAVIVAPEGAQVHDLARKAGLETAATADAPRHRHMPHRDLLSTPGRLAMLRGFGPGLVLHANDLGALQAWGPAARLAGAPVVHHNRAFDRDWWPNRLVLGLADHVISISGSCDAHVDFVPAARRSTLVNAFSTPLEVDAGAARAQLLSELEPDDDARLVGFVGNYWRRKRPEFFIDVAQVLAGRDPRARFVVFGRPGDVTAEDLAARIAAAGLEGRVLLAGFRLPPEANLAALDLLMMPALREPFGRTPVEALILGVPYVAADDAGHSEIFRRWGGGLMAATDASPEVYADLAETVLRDPAAVALPLAERRTVAASLTPERHAADVMAIYRRLHA